MAVLDVKITTGVDSLLLELSTEVEEVTQTVDYHVTKISAQALVEKYVANPTSLLMTRSAWKALELWDRNSASQASDIYLYELTKDEDTIPLDVYESLTSAHLVLARYAHAVIEDPLLGIDDLENWDDISDFLQ
jgi:hypothetical protein